MPIVRVPGAAVLPPGATRVFELHVFGQTKQGFVLNYRGTLRAFLNECPHWSVELDLGDEHFFDEDLERIYCKNHGALFEPLSGACETGPCLGRELVSFPVEVDDTDALVEVP